MGRGPDDRVSGGRRGKTSKTGVEVSDEALRGGQVRGYKGGEASGPADTLAPRRVKDRWNLKQCKNRPCARKKVLCVARKVKIKLCVEFKAVWRLKY